MVDVIGLHLGHVVHVRDDHIAWVAQDEVSRHTRRRKERHDFWQGVQVPVSDITRQQALQVGQDFASAARGDRCRPGR